MAEALGVGASVIAVISLAGQVIQGCEAVRRLLDAIRYASEDICTLRTEISNFELAMKAFEETLSEIDSAGLRILGDNHPKLALEFGYEAVLSLRTHLESIDMSKSRWVTIKFVLSKDKCAKHLARIERAKGYVLAAQATALLSLEYEQATTAALAQQSLKSLASSVADSSQLISTLPPKLDDVQRQTIHTNWQVSEMRREFNARISDLTACINAVYNQKFSAFATHVTRKDRVQQPQLPAAAQLERPQIKPVFEEFNQLPLGIAGIIKDTFCAVLSEFYRDLSKSTSTETSCKASESIDKLTNSKEDPITRKVLRQSISTKCYMRAIGIVSVRCTTTTILERFETGCRISDVTRTIISLNPDPEFLWIGIYCSFLQNDFASSIIPIEATLRVFNVLDTDAPIIIACRSGNLSSVRKLIASGAASPFDCLWGEKSLLDLILMRILSVTAAATHNASATASISIFNLIEVYKEIVNHGLDPGLPRANDDPYGISPLSALAALSVKCIEELQQHIASLARIIICRSTHDPLSGADLRKFTWVVKVAKFKKPIFDVMQTQEEWSIDWPTIAELRSENRISIRKFLTGDPESDERCIQVTKESLLLDANRSFFHQVLDDCKKLEEKLWLFHIILRLLADHELRIEMVSQKSLRRLFWKAELCLQSCEMSGLVSTDPPLQFIDMINELESFLVHHTWGFIVRLLYKYGWNVQQIHDVLSAGLVASLAYQLANLSRPAATGQQMSARRGPIKPGSLRYYPIDSASWSLYLMSLRGEEQERGPPSITSEAPASVVLEESNGCNESVCQPIVKLESMPTLYPSVSDAAQEYLPLLPAKETKNGEIFVLNELPLKAKSNDNMELHMGCQVITCSLEETSRESNDSHQKSISQAKCDFELMDESEKGHEKKQEKEEDDEDDKILQGIAVALSVFWT